MEPLVSILIPAYNSERWLGDALKSVLEQTWRRKEVIVVDDGSSDRTLDVARRFASRDVLVLSQENQGPAAARNHALVRCQGDLIQWLDADDLLASDKIERQAKEWVREGTGRTLYSGPWAYFTHRPDRARTRETALWRDMSPLEWLLLKLEQNLYMSNSSWLVSRELTEAAGPWNTQLLSDDDGEYFCRVLMASCSVRFIPGALSYYRRTGSSSVSSLGASARKLLSQHRSIELHVEYLRSLEDSERVRRACITFLQRWLVYFYPEMPEQVRAMEQLAVAMGGKLETPRLPWKYALIQKTFGWRAAKKMRVYLPRFRASLFRWAG